MDNLTLLELTNRLHPRGGVLPFLIDVVSTRKPILRDITWRQSNMTEGHKITQRLALPSGTWREINAAVQTESTETGVHVETLGSLDTVNSIDAKFADLENINRLRFQEDQGAVEGLSQTLGTALFYENVGATPAAFEGLANRYDTTATSNPAADQIIKADASASGNDQASIWLVGWGDRTIYGIVPNNGTIGLQIRPYARSIEHSSSGEREVFKTYFSWNAGLAVADYRYAVRICNIDTGNLTADASSGADLIDAMIEARHAIEEVDSVRATWYMNRNIFMWFSRQLSNATSNKAEFVERDGQMMESFSRIPIRVEDSLLNTESVVS